MPFFYMLFFWRLTYQFAKSSCKCLQSIVSLPGSVFAKLLGCATSHAESGCDKRYKLPQFSMIPQGWPERGPGENGWPALGWSDWFQDGREKLVCCTQYFTLRTQDLLKMGSTRRMPFGAKFPPPNLQDIHQEASYWWKPVWYTGKITEHENPVGLTKREFAKISSRYDSQGSSGRTSHRCPVQTEIVVQ